MSEVTVVFADLTGSTGVFEALGNVKATQTITRLTDWIGQVCTARRGRVVKNLGDGVLMVFKQNTDAVDAACELQRQHFERLKNWPELLQMHLQVGLARGPVVEKDNDFFGDAVNVASRLSDLSGPDQILATDTVIDQLPPGSLVRFRGLGALDIRGRQEACTVHRVEWQSEVLSEFFTQPASLSVSQVSYQTPRQGFIALAWLDLDTHFSSTDAPIHLGRDPQAEFVINDRRVSRYHAKITWRTGKFYLEDVSSYGTWVRFTGTKAVVALRRQACVLLVEGAVALGASFDDFTVPTVAFKFKPSISN